MSWRENPDYRKAVRDLSEFYVQRMPSEDYQMVGRMMQFPGGRGPVGVVRTDFESWRVYANNVIESFDSFKWMEEEFAAREFCERVSEEAHGYSCEFTDTKPAEMSNTDDFFDNNWDLYFESLQVRESVRTENFFEEVFDLDDLESEYQVEILGESEK
jgi:hypothetical protein